MQIWLQMLKKKEKGDSTPLFPTISKHPCNAERSLFTWSYQVGWNGFVFKKQTAELIMIHRETLIES